MTLIAEDLLLLLLDDEKGTMAASSSHQPLLGGALLLELALAGDVAVEPAPTRWRRAKVSVVEGAAPADPMLRTALAVAAEKERPAQDLVGRIGKGARGLLLERLVGRGLLERREGKVLGLFPHRTWPAADARHEQEVRRRLQDALVAGVDPDARTAAVIALLHAVDQAHKQVDRGALSSGDVRRRAKAIAEGAWAAEAVRDAVQAAAAATTAAVTAATAASVAASGSS